MNTKEKFEHATKTRLDLLQLGWDVRPSIGKACLLPGWNSYDGLPTEHNVRSWPTVQSNPTIGVGGPALTTGIRLSGNMIAIDVDVEGTALANIVEDIAAEVFGAVFDDMPLRHSESVSWMALAQCDEPLVMLRTPKYDSLDEEASHMVEVYGGGHGGKFFALYGPHSEGRSYQWVDGPEPLTIRPDELPQVSKDQVHEFMMKVTDAFDSAGGIERRVNSKALSVDGDHSDVVYDLADDAVFDTLQQGELSIDQVREELQAGAHLTCSATCIDGVEHKNKTRCTMSVDHSGFISVFDFGDAVTHRQIEAENHSPHDKIEQLGEALRSTMSREVSDALETAADDGADTAEFEAQLEELLATLVFNNTEGTYHWMRRGRVWKGIKRATLKTDLKEFDLTWEGPRGGQRRMSLVDAFDSCPGRAKIAGVRFDPRYPSGFLGDDGEPYANGYFGLPDLGGSDKTAEGVVDRFMEHLVPDYEEREWLWDWMAAKYQEPWQRMCAALFVAPGIQGAGRGTLFSILDIVFGGYTSPVSEDDLLNARFNGFMENNLLLFANEMGGLSYRDRKKGYETLKVRVDPSHSEVTIERKGIEAYRTRTFVSFMIATNNPGALTMDAEDRRFAILTNGGMLKGRLLEDILSIGKARLAATVSSRLKHRTVTRDLSTAPNFAGREIMLQSNETELDDHLAAVISEAPPWRAWVRSEFENAVKLRMTDSSKGHVPGLRTEVTEMVGRRGERLGAWLLPSRVKVGSSPVAVLAKNPGLFKSLTPEQRAKVVKGVEPDWDETNVVPLK